MNNLQGPLFMVIAMAGFASEDAVVKALSTTLPPGQIALVLGVFGTLAFWVAIWRRGERLFDLRGLRGVALLRNLTEMGAAMCMILGVALVPLSVVSSITQAMPLAVTLGAALFLGEKVGWRRWTAILVGFLGVMLIVRPGTQGFDHLALLPLAAVVFLSARDIATRVMGTAFSAVQVSGWGFMAVIPGGVLLLLLRGESLVAPDAREWALLMLTVVLGITSYMLLVLATRVGNMAATTPFRYSRLVFAMILGMVFFAERPDGWTLAGSAIVVGAGLYTLLREIRLNRRPVETSETATLP